MIDNHSNVSFDCFPFRKIMKITKQKEKGNSKVNVSQYDRIYK